MNNNICAVAKTLREDGYDITCKKLLVAIADRLPENGEITDEQIIKATSDFFMEQSNKRHFYMVENFDMEHYANGPKTGTVYVMDPREKNAYDALFCTFNFSVDKDYVVRAHLPSSLEFARDNYETIERRIIKDAIEKDENKRKMQKEIDYER